MGRVPWPPPHDFGCPSIFNTEELSLVPNSGPRLWGLDSSMVPGLCPPVELVVKWRGRLPPETESNPTMYGSGAGER